MRDILDGTNFGLFSHFIQSHVCQVIHSPDLLFDSLRFSVRHLKKITTLLIQNDVKFKDD